MRCGPSQRTDPFWEFQRYSASYTVLYLETSLHSRPYHIYIYNDGNPGIIHTVVIKNGASNCHQRRHQQRRRKPMWWKCVFPYFPHDNVVPSFRLFGGTNCRKIQLVVSHPIVYCSRYTTTTSASAGVGSVKSLAGCPCGRFIVK